MSTKIKQKLNITRAILIGTAFTAMMSASAYAQDKKAGSNQKSQSLAIKAPTIETVGDKEDEAKTFDTEGKGDHTAAKESFHNRLSAIARFTLAIGQEEWMSDDLRKELMHKIFKTLFSNEEALAVLKEALHVKHEIKSNKL